MEDTNNSKTAKKGLFRYKGGGEQTVISFLGIELTAPSNLRNPGIVYISFIVVNLILFLVLKSFVIN